MWQTKLHIVHTFLLRSSPLSRDFFFSFVSGVCAFYFHWTSGLSVMSAIVGGWAYERREPNGWVAGLWACGCSSALGCNCGCSPLAHGHPTSTCDAGINQCYTNEIANCIVHDWEGWTWQAFTQCAGVTCWWVADCQCRQVHIQDECLWDCCSVRMELGQLRRKSKLLWKQISHRHYPKFLGFWDFSPGYSQIFTRLLTL